MFGISEEEFVFLKLNENQRILKENIDKDSKMLALKGINGTICRQINALQKCKNKLPHFYKALCVIPPISIEQASSIYTTNTKEHSGNRALDLTCGLGGDSTHFSKTFSKVISIERETLLSEIAKYNFEKLNISNIELINDDAQNFLENYCGEKFDMIYCDPARRDEKRRTFLLEDCSPNIIEILPLIEKHTSKLVVKLSPLFDCNELEKIFSNYNITITVVSYDNECKEVLAELNFDKETQITRKCCVIKKDGTYKSYIFPTTFLTNDIDENSYNKYLYIADVTFKKFKNTEELIAKYYPKIKAKISNNVIISDDLIENFAGRSYEIIDILEQKQKALKKYFKANNIKSATIIKEGTTKSIEEIRKSFGLRDGAQATLVITAKQIFVVK
ncbi:MAG: methyltransferase domain-containing protein [Bacteroidetes bacterium]|nr:methyltransferase domain-containing protein [Bacteroidota bacterium]